jgi:FtsP/CotA-like multicopper oxidase with cupredoxin domain
MSHAEHIPLPRVSMPVATALVVLASVGFGLVPFFARSLTDGGMAATAVALWRYALGAFVLVLIAGVAAVWLSQSTTSPPAATVSFSLVGGEVTKNFDDQLGWTMAGENLNTMSSPGPLLEVEVGTEVTLTFTNRGGWSGLDEAIPHSFRVVPSIPSADTLWDSDTGLVDPEASATITFTPTEVGDYRYVSDGLGAAARGMFGRFVVIEPQDQDPSALDMTDGDR